jgi:hypothetical protein
MIARHGLPMTRPIAMQKVEGSNSFSRFLRFPGADAIHIGDDGLLSAPDPGIMNPVRLRVGFRT